MLALRRFAATSAFPVWCVDPRRCAAVAQGDGYLSVAELRALVRDKFPNSQCDFFDDVFRITPKIAQFAHHGVAAAAAATADAGAGGGAHAGHDHGNDDDGDD